MLTPGDPAPWFVAASNVNPSFHFDSVAGRYVVLSFFGSTKHPATEEILKGLIVNHRFFDPEHLLFCGVCNDTVDLQHLLKTDYPGLKFFADVSNAIARGYGLVKQSDNAESLTPNTFLLDEGLRVLHTIPIETDGAAHVRRITSQIREPPPLAQSHRTAPVLMLDRVFEPKLCRNLIEVFERQGGEPSGFMREIGGMTKAVSDKSFKSRRDHIVTDDRLISEIKQSISRKIIPEIRKAFNFTVTRIERYLIACYDSNEQGHFNPHRDNTTKGTAHRRFAVSINLNSDEYEGGDLRFPEFGPRTYRPSTGGAVIFGCSLLHEATRVRTGKRFAFLPFLYDEAAAEIRESNRQFLSDESINLDA
jgi:peroxiredoxin/predicted 2-oxoglutarate/Fe(II)-dependent dioxygenase YbiX